MGDFDRFVRLKVSRQAWIRVPTTAEAATWRLPAVLALSLLALVVVVVGSPGVLGVLLVGTFMLVTPGLMLAELVRVGDGLLSLVLAMMVGPVLWVLLPTLEVFAGVWHPEATVGFVATSLGLVAAVLLVRRSHGPVLPALASRWQLPIRGTGPAGRDEPTPVPKPKQLQPVVRSRAADRSPAPAMPAVAESAVPEVPATTKADPTEPAATKTAAEKPAAEKAAAKKTAATKPAAKKTAAKKTAAKKTATKKTAAEVTAARKAAAKKAAATRKRHRENRLKEDRRREDRPQGAGRQGDRRREDRRAEDRRKEDRSDEGAGPDAGHRRRGDPPGEGPQPGR